tara:strand:- start:1550 stop:1963 length:414 start_codon:yes stop_codon:yes gene_type:complete
MATDSSGIMGLFSTIASLLKNAFSPPKQLKTIPSGLILLGAKFRGGLSSIDIASKIIERKKEIGIGIGPLPSGARNIDIQMEVIRVEEIVNALTTNAVIEIEIPPGIQLTAAGGNAGGPIVVQGATVQLIKAKGIIR